MRTPAAPETSSLVAAVERVAQSKPLHPHARGACGWLNNPTEFSSSISNGQGVGVGRCIVKPWIILCVSEQTLPRASGISGHPAGSTSSDYGVAQKLAVRGYNWTCLDVFGWRPRRSEKPRNPSGKSLPFEPTIGRYPSRVPRCWPDASGSRRIMRVGRSRLQRLPQVSRQSPT